MKCYISGPITGMPDGNKKAFAYEATLLHWLGMRPVNPHDNGLPDGLDWVDYMRADIKLLMDCDTISMLPGWTDSRGARLEHLLATELGLAVIGADK